MKLLSLIKQSLIAILRNKGRSFLTVLGIIIGIGSVIALIALGNGVQVSINSQINQLGADLITVTPGQPLGPANGSDSGSSQAGSGFNQLASTLTQQDLDSLSDKAKHPLIKELTGEISASTIINSRVGEQRYNVVGVSENFFSIRKMSIQAGTLPTTDDLSRKNKVIVLGNKVAEDIFGSDNPLDQTLTINTASYRVIGVLEKAEETNFNNPNVFIYMPHSSAADVFRTTTFSNFLVKAINQDEVDNLKDDIEKTLLANHRISNPDLADFSVFTSADLLSTVGTITGLLTSLLAGIAAISLVVSGIGIMNIMLVSVTERTREIGLRKAVGAKMSDILIQFVIEAVLLTVIGGLLGIGLGVLIGKIASRFIGFDAIVTMSAIALAVGVSSGIGLIFGIYPAAKAARLNPIDALRYE